MCCTALPGGARQQAVIVQKHLITEGNALAWLTTKQGLRPVLW